MRPDEFLYLCCHTAGVRSYTVSDAGALSLKDTEAPGAKAQGAFADANFVYVAFDTSGVYSYAIDDDGLMTLLDSDGTSSDKAYSIWGDGDFIYCAHDAGGIHSYSVNEAGSWTHIDSDDQGSNAYDVHGDGNFIYLANGAGGVVVYSVDGAGNLTYVSTKDDGGTYRGVFAYNGYVYCARDSSGLTVYSVDGSGTLSTAIDTATDGTCYKVRMDRATGYIYVAGFSAGIFSYSFDGSSLTLEDTASIGGHHVYTIGVGAGYGNRAYAASTTSGLNAFSVDSAGDFTSTDSDNPGGTILNCFAGQAAFPDSVEITAVEQMDYLDYDAAGNQHWPGSVKISYNLNSW